MVHQDNCMLNKSDFCGKIILPGSVAYEKARQEWNRSIQKFPVAIAYCRSAYEICRALYWAKRHGLTVRIRSGGHNYEGFSVGNSALVIDTSCMKNAVIDVQNQCVRIGGGVDNRQLYQLVGSEGYPFPSGTCPSVCASGLTLGGGWGLSSRLFGLTCDSLLEIEMVDVRGRLIKANRQCHPNLFWASCGGGGGNFGVITSLSYRLLARLFDVTFVNIEYPQVSQDTAVEYLDTWQQWLENADVRITPLSRIFNSAEKGRGIFLRGIFYGTPAEAQQELEPFLNITGAELTIQAMTFLEAASIAASVYPPYELFRFAGRFVYEKYTKDELARIVSLISTRSQGADDASLALYALGGKVSERTPFETAFYYRGARYIMGIETVWQNPADEQQNLAWLRPRYAYLESISFGSYINFPYLGTSRYMDAYYGENARRLIKIKQQYDPCNLFCFPQSIRSYQFW